MTRYAEAQVSLRSLHNSTLWLCHMTCHQFYSYCTVNRPCWTDAIDGFHGTFYYGNWRALHHHAACWLVNIYITCSLPSSSLQFLWIHLYCSTKCCYMIVEIALVGVGLQCGCKFISVSTNTPTHVSSLGEGWEWLRTTWIYWDTFHVTSVLLYCSTPVTGTLYGPWCPLIMCTHVKCQTSSECDGIAHAVVVIQVSVVCSVPHSSPTSAPCSQEGAASTADWWVSCSRNSGV